MQETGFELKHDGRLRALREADFPLSLRGYSRPEVDRFLGETAEWVEQLMQRGADASAVQSELSRVGEQTAGILSAAEDTARRMRAEAADEVEKARAAARDHAARMRAEAESYAEAKCSDADREATAARTALKEDLRRSRIEASAKVEKMVREAEARAEQIVEDALRRRDRLNAATEQLKRTRGEILEDAGSLADELAQVVATHAEVTRNVVQRDEATVGGGATNTGAEPESDAESARERGLLDP
jgi:DivIVA domain-containing protein